MVHVGSLPPSTRMSDPPPQGSSPRRPQPALGDRAVGHLPVAEDRHSEAAAPAVRRAGAGPSGPTPIGARRVAQAGVPEIVRYQAGAASAASSPIATTKQSDPRPSGWGDARSPPWRGAPVPGPTRSRSRARRAAQRLRLPVAATSAEQSPAPAVNAVPPNSDGGARVAVAPLPSSAAVGSMPSLMSPFEGGANRGHRS